MAIVQGKNTRQYLEQIYALVGLLHMTGCFNPLFYNVRASGNVRLDHTAVTEGSLGMQVFGSSIYLVALVLLLPRIWDIVGLLSRNKALLLFLTLILASALWSELPGVTLRRSAALMGTTIFAVYLAMRFNSDELLKMLALVFALAAVENFVFVLLAPEAGIHTDVNRGAWGGVLGHKNILGRTMVLGMLVLWVATEHVRASKPIVWGAFALCLFLVVMSQSRTSWIAAICLVLAIPFFRYLRGSRMPLLVRILLVAMVGLGGVSLLVLQYADVGLELLGRTATFSGRTDIWATSLSVGMDRPILGHGYRTFWTFGLTNRLLVGNAHNSFLDLWLELGLAGLGLFIATMVVVGRRALRRLTTSNDRRGLMYPMIILFLVLFGLAAQVFPDHGTIEWVLYIIVSLYLTPFANAPVPSPVADSDRPEAPVSSAMPAE